MFGQHGQEDGEAAQHREHGQREGLRAPQSEQHVANVDEWKWPYLPKCIAARSGKCDNAQPPARGLDERGFLFPNIFLNRLNHIQFNFSFDMWKMYRNPFPV